MNATTFLAGLSSLTFRDAFNPYVDRCRVHDCKDAPQRRATVLRQMVEVAAAREIDSLWVGRDLGHRGGRRTGLALTDDCHLGLHANHWGIAARRSTLGKPVAERTAAVVWDVLN